MAGLSLSLRQPLQLAELSHNARLGFVTTNLAYWIVAILVLTGGELPAVPVADCLGGVCSSPTFHGIVLTLMAVSSTVWHGAQCEVMEWFSHVMDLSTSRCLRRLLLCDVCCASFVFLVGIVCFRPWRTCFWILPAFSIFLLAREAKRRREWHRYAVLHGIWHLLSSIAAYEILYNVTVPPWQDYESSIHSNASTKDLA